MKKVKLYLPLIILATILVVAAFAVYKSNIKQNLGKENFLKSQKIRFFDEKSAIPDLFDGKKQLSLQDLVNKNGKYSLINVFASWCSSCLKEHELLFSIQNYGKIDLIGIAWNDYHENSKKFLKKFGNPYQKVALDSKGYLNKILGVTAIPETFLIDSNGYVIYRHQGVLTDQALRRILLLTK